PEYFNKLRKSVERIVTHSVMFFWDSMRSFICIRRTDNLRKVHHLTYVYDGETIYFDYEFSCQLDETASQIGNAVKEESLKFIEQMRAINSTIEEVYEKIHSSSSEVIKLNKETEKFFESQKDALNLFKNSLEDGK